MTAITNNLYPTSGAVSGLPSQPPPDPSQFLNNVQALAAQGQSSSSVPTAQQSLYAQLSQAATTLQSSSSDATTRSAARQQVHQLLQQLGITPQALMNASSSSSSAVGATDTDDLSVDGTSSNSGVSDTSGYGDVDGYDDTTNQDDLSTLGVDTTDGTGTTSSLQDGIHTAFASALSSLGLDMSSLPRGESLTQAASEQGISSDQVTSALTTALQTQFPDASDDAVSSMVQKMESSPHHHMHGPPPVQSTDDTDSLTSDGTAQSNVVSASSFPRTIYA